MSMTTDNSPQRKPDALRDIYQDAVANDRGPSAQSTEAILAHARQRASATKDPHVSRTAAQTQGKPKPAPAANDRFWLRHALGGLAAVGLVGWLMLQHAAWWDGSDKGIGAEPAGHVVAETPQAFPADASSASAVTAQAVEAAQASAADAAPAQEAMAATAPAPAPVANAARAPTRSSAAMAEKSQANRPSVQAEIAPDAMKEEATVAASPSASRPVRNAPAASKMQSQPAPISAEVADQAAARVQEKAQERTAEKDKDLSQLPLCPEEPVGAEAKAAAKAARKGEEAAPACRPRKPHEKRSTRTVPGSDAADSVVNPVD